MSLCPSMLRPLNFSQRDGWSITEHVQKTVFFIRKQWHLAGAFTQMTYRAMTAYILCRWILQGIEPKTLMLWTLLPTEPHWRNRGWCGRPSTSLGQSSLPPRTSIPGGVRRRSGKLSKTPATQVIDCSLCSHLNRFYPKDWWMVHQLATKWLTPTYMYILPQLPRNPAHWLSTGTPCTVYTVASLLLFIVTIFYFY